MMGRPHASNKAVGVCYYPEHWPDMLPVNRDGNSGGFGSRRHYGFSDGGYRAECARIVTALARHFGSHPGTVGCQTDNEFDCHDATLSYSTVDLAAFRDWLAKKHQSPDVLNRLHCDIIRKHSPGHEIIHNFMGRTLAFNYSDSVHDLSQYEIGKLHKGQLEFQPSGISVFRTKP